MSVFGAFVGLIPGIIAKDKLSEGWSAMTNLGDVAIPVIAADPSIASDGQKFAAELAALAKANRLQPIWSDIKTFGDILILLLADPSYQPAAMTFLKSFA